MSADPMSYESHGVPTCEKCGAPHERDGQQTCKAHRRDGKACIQWPMRGGVVCRLHGGSAPATKRKAAERHVMSFKEGKIRQLLSECDIPQQHPLDGLLEVVRHSGAMMRMLAGLVGELAVHPSESEEEWTMGEDGNLVIRNQGSLYGPDHKGDATPSILVQLYDRWSDRYARACKLALDANIDERIVRNAEATSEVLFGAVTRAISSVALDETQMHQLRTALAQELRQISGMGELG